MTGLAQGVASIGLNYLTEELEVPPLLANLGFAAISAGLEGLISNPEHPIEGIVSNIWDKFTGNVLSMLGYNPIPNRDSKRYYNLDEFGNIIPGTFKDNLFNSDMGNYYWQRSVYASQILDFAKITAEDGIDVALNTYATALFNGIAINSIVNIAKKPIESIGTYFKDLIDSFKTNPSGTPDVQERTLDDGTKEYDVKLKDAETGEDALTGTFAEKWSEEFQKYFYEFKGYELPSEFEIYGEWMLGTDGQIGLGEGWFNYFDGTVYQEQYVIKDEYGMPVQSLVRLTNPENNKSIVFLPIEGEDYVVPDGIGGFYNTDVSYYENNNLVYNYLFDNGISANSMMLTNGHLFEELANVWNLPVSTELNNDYYINFSKGQGANSYDVIIERLDSVSPDYLIPESGIIDSIYDLEQTLDGLVNDPNLVGIESLVDMAGSVRDMYAAGLLITGGSAAEVGTLGISSPLTVPVIALGSSLYLYASLNFMESYNNFVGVLHNDPALMEYSWAESLLGEKYGSAVNTLEEIRDVYEYITQPLDEGMKQTITTSFKGLLSLLRLVIRGIEAIEDLQ